MKNIRIIQTTITPDIYVSTAGIWYDPSYFSPNGHFQYETWIFSKNNKQKNVQVIHGSCAWVDFYYLKKSIKIHRYISRNLKEVHLANILS